MIYYLTATSLRQLTQHASNSSTIMATGSGAVGV